MKVLIIEDEEVVARRLGRLVKSILGSRLASLETATTLEDALETLRARSLDLLFLDLDLNGDDGFAVLREAVAGSFQTIIVSAHADQAITAFEHGVTDFVAKPYTEDRLRQALGRVEQRQPASGDRLRVLAVRRYGEVHLIPLTSIVRISAADDYAEVHCDDGSSWLHDRTLAALATLLPSRFERVHRSHIVDVGRIARWDVAAGSRYHLVLDRGDQVPASRTWIQTFRGRLAARPPPSPPKQ